jgi:hypothetical protein
MKVSNFKNTVAHPLTPGFATTEVRYSYRFILNNKYIHGHIFQIAIISDELEQLDIRALISGRGK